MRRLGLAFTGLLLALVCIGAAAFASDEKIILNPNGARQGIDFESDPAGAMKSARERVAAGDLPGAIKGLATYVAAHATEGDPARLLGDLYYRSGDLPKAESTYRSILALYPKDRETHNRLGTVLATENRVDDAIAEFNASLPGTDSVGDLVALHAKKGDLQAYRAKLELLADTYPTFTAAQSELGQAYAALHRPSEAARMFRRALDNDPTDITALNGLGLAMLDLRAYDLAAGNFKRCLQIDPTDYSCADNLGATYLETGRQAEAEAILTTAHNLAPERVEALVNFGYLADIRGDWKGAVSWYVKALALSPFARDAYFDLGLVYDQHQLYDQAEAVLVKGIAVNPNDGPLHAVLGQTYQDAGKNGLALEQFRLAAASLDPTIVALARSRFAALDGGHTPAP
jgi:tetratricopeptide (TPR) repeat protein